MKLIFLAKFYKIYTESCVEEKIAFSYAVYHMSVSVVLCVQ